MNTYIVTFDRQTGKSYKEFHENFVNHAEISNWWHYIRSSYIIKTTLSSNDLSDHFTSCARKAGVPTTHLVVKADLSDRQGMLIKDAWSWLKSNK